MEKKKVIGYCRVSTIGQAEDGDSLETQSNSIKNYCLLKNLDLVSVHQEQGVSGSMDPHERPQLKFVLSSLEIKQDGVSGLVVTKIDRLSRSTNHFINLMSEFKNKDIDFFCINPDMDSNSTVGKFTMNLLSIVSNLELDMIKDRTKEVMQTKKSKNELVGTVPFGKKLKVNSNILEDDAEELKTIQIIKDLRKVTTEVKTKAGVKQKLTTYKKICEELVKQNRLNKHGKALWFPSQIRNILNDGHYKSGRVKKE